MIKDKWLYQNSKRVPLKYPYGCAVRLNEEKGNKESLKAETKTAFTLEKYRTKPNLFKLD